MDTGTKKIWVAVGRPTLAVEVANAGLDEGASGKAVVEVEDFVRDVARGSSRGLTGTILVDLLISCILLRQLELHFACGRYSFRLPPTDSYRVVSLHDLYWRHLLRTCYLRRFQGHIRYEYLTSPQKAILVQIVHHNEKQPEDEHQAG